MADSTYRMLQKQARDAARRIDLEREAARKPDPTPAPPVRITLPWPPAELSPNARPSHWARRAEPAKAYREACFLAVQQVRRGRRVADADVLVQLTFVPPTKRDRDADNLVARMKSGLDGVAAALGINDTRFRLAAPLLAEPAKTKADAHVLLTLSVIETPADPVATPPRTAGQE